METKTKGLTFGEAVEAMKQGKKVRRKNYPKNNYLFCREGDLIYDEKERSIGLGVIEFEATDWEIVDEKPFVLAEKEVVWDDEDGEQKFNYVKDVCESIDEDLVSFRKKDVRRAYDEILKASKAFFDGFNENGSDKYLYGVSIEKIKEIFGFEKEESKCEHEPEYDRCDVEGNTTKCKKCGAWY